MIIFSVFFFFLISHFIWIFLKSLRLSLVKWQKLEISGKIRFVMEFKGSWQISKDICNLLFVWFLCYWKLCVCVVHVYVLVFVYVCVCVGCACECVWVCICVWVIDIRWSSSVASYYIFWDTFSNIKWCSPILLWAIEAPMILLSFPPTCQNFMHVLPC